MYIKQVFINGHWGFQHAIGPADFSPKVNCVVGARNSGKSSLIDAMLFVLRDLFHLPGKEKQGIEGMLLRQWIPMYVEIVFDNSDKLIPVDKEEVRLRKSIRDGKDEYRLNGDLIEKTEVMNLLKNAGGFLSSNPYCVVQKKKVKNLMYKNDFERLDLLKEIAGARVYEEKWQESLKIVQEIDKKRKLIVRVVQYLDKRLEELNRENEEEAHEHDEYSVKRELLQTRLNELDEDDKKMKEHISVLNIKKDESIERTFEDVDKNFQEFCAELGCQGFLILMKKKDNNYVGDDQDDDEPRPTDLEGWVEKYIGVGVKVTRNGETQGLDMLVSQERRVVAVALIFAIQRYNPAPFYIFFDDIDAELDLQQRIALRNMVRRQADTGSTQFIIFPSREELVEIAENTYGVSRYKVRVVNLDWFRNVFNYGEYEEDVGWPSVRTGLRF